MHILFDFFNEQKNVLAVLFFFHFIKYRDEIIAIRVRCQREKRQSVFSSLATFKNTICRLGGKKIT